MTDKEILEKLNSYNTNLVDIKFILISKYTYLLNNDIQSNNTEDNIREIPYLRLGEKDIKFYIFHSNTKERIIEYLDILDNHISNLKNENNLFFYLKENYTGLSKKEERKAKILSIYKND